AHDENMTFDEMVAQIGKPLAETLRKKSLELYEAGRAWADGRGIIVADTKFEFGVVGGQPILIDEALTPDSSRFWDKATYEPGKPQDSFDKQVIRDFLEKELKWNKKPPVPSLPAWIVEKAQQRYQQVFDRLTLMRMSDGKRL
ncbi:MAG: phosphoribosylaminoimidazolesuccinocarboxamide synthase, partial [Elusimicrobia bacterium]|nr:phosphoribosylaminoimidazolesuccinocarboxamide synthase [Elusimicrobiota bacterium]